MHRILVITLALSMSGCGVEVASTAAVSGAAKAKEARQAQQTMEQLKQKLDTATQAGQDRAVETEKTIGY
jgi:PBP1b-binding outer membrane lipoprotein LpoB